MADKSENKFEDFLAYVYNWNERFLVRLEECSRNDVETGEFEKSEGLLSYTLKESDTGMHVLKVLTAMVTHPQFKEEMSQGHPHTGLKKKGNYLRTKIPYADEKPVLTFHCRASEKQPGNAVENQIGGYKKKYGNIELKQFSTIFLDFLKMGGKAFVQEHSEKYWRLSVALIYDIARRIPLGDVHHHIPVGPTIMLAMEADGDTITQLSCISKKKSYNRNDVFRNYASIWFQKVEGNEKKDVREVRKLFERMMAVFTEDEDEEDDTLLYLRYLFLEESGQGEGSTAGSATTALGGDSETEVDDLTKKVKRDLVIKDKTGDEHETVKYKSGIEGNEGDVKKALSASDQDYEKNCDEKKPLKNPDGNEKDDVSEEFERLDENTVDDDGDDGDDDDDRKNDDGDEDNHGHGYEGGDSNGGQRRKKIGKKTEKMKTPKIHSPSEESKKTGSAPISLKSSGACHQNGVKKA